MEKHLRTDHPLAKLADFGAEQTDFGERVVAEVTDLIAHSSEFLIHTLESSLHVIVQPIDCSQLNAEYCGDSDDACPADALLQCRKSAASLCRASSAIPKDRTAVSTELSISVSTKFFIASAILGSMPLSTSESVEEVSVMLGWQE